MSSQTLSVDKRDGVLAASIEPATVRTASLPLAQICAKSLSKVLFAAIAENIFSANLHRNFLRLDYGVTSAATTRQAFTSREQRGERIVTRTVKSLHQSNH